MPRHAKEREVRLSVALHGALNPPEGWVEDMGEVQATNLWFDCEMSLTDFTQLVREIQQDETYHTLERWMTEEMDGATRFYRVWDNTLPSYEEDCSEGEDECRSRGYNSIIWDEFHVNDADDSHCNPVFLGPGFAEPPVTDYALSLISEG